MKKQNVAPFSKIYVIRAMGHGTGTEVVLSGERLLFGHMIHVALSTKSCPWGFSVNLHVFWAVDHGQECLRKLNTGAFPRGRMERNVSPVEDICISDGISLVQTHSFDHPTLPESVSQNSRYKS